MGHRRVIQQRNHHQGKQGRDQDAEDQRDRQPVEDRIVQDKQRANHRRQRGQQDGLGTNLGGTNHRLFKTQPLATRQFDKVHQQDRVTYDDPGQRNHADHRGRRELSPQQRMARHHTDHGQRDRRHNDQRHQIGAEPGHHQQIDQHHADRVGSAHIAEGLVGHLPLPIPQQPDLTRGIRLGDKILW